MFSLFLMNPKCNVVITIKITMLAQYEQVYRDIYFYFLHMNEEHLNIQQ